MNSYNTVKQYEYYLPLIDVNLNLNHALVLTISPLSILVFPNHNNEHLVRIISLPTCISYTHYITF